MSTQTISRPRQTVTQPAIRRRPKLEPHSLQRHERLPSIALRAAVRKPLKKKCCSQCDMVHPERAAISITKAVQETINGARPLPQLTRWVSRSTQCRHATSRYYSANKHHIAAHRGHHPLTYLPHQTRHRRRCSDDQRRRKPTCRRHSSRSVPWPLARHLSANDVRRTILLLTREQSQPRPLHYLTATFLPWQRLYFSPEPQGQGALREVPSKVCPSSAACLRTVRTSCSPPPSAGAKYCNCVGAEAPSRFDWLASPSPCSASSAALISMLNMYPTDSSLMPSVMASYNWKPSRWYSTSGFRWAIARSPIPSLR